MHQIKPFRFNVVDALWIIGIFALYWVLEHYIDTLPQPWPAIFGFAVLCGWVFHYVRKFYEW